jgi:hypothetical protein
LKRVFLETKSFHSDAVEGEADAKIPPPHFEVSCHLYHQTMISHHAGTLNPESALKMLKRIRNCKFIFCKY